MHNRIRHAWLTVLVAMLTGLLPVFGADNVELLIRKLTTGDPDTRSAAGKDLVRLGAPAVEPLLGLLKDTDPQRRAGAIPLLGAIADARAVAPLADALRDKGRRVSYAAAWALRKTGKPAVPALLAALGDTNTEVRYCAAYALAGITDSSILEPCLTALKDSEPRVRYYAVAGLENLADPRAADALHAALKDPEALVRNAVPFALLKIKDNRAFESLTALLAKDVPSDVRFRAAFAIWQTKDSRAVDALIVALKDEDCQVRCHSAWALGDLKDARGVVPLIELLDSKPDPETERYATRSLCQITGMDFGRDGAKWRDWYDKQRQTKATEAKP